MIPPSLSPIICSDYVSTEYIELDSTVPTLRAPGAFSQSREVSSFRYYCYSALRNSKSSFTTRMESGSNPQTLKKKTQRPSKLKRLPSSTTLDLQTCQLV